MSEEKFELHEKMSDIVAEIDRDLKIRRHAVLAEVMAKIKELAEKGEEAQPNQVLLRGMRDGDIHVDAAENHMLVHSAELIATLVEVALLRGAGVLAAAAAPPGEPLATSQPPSTAESLGDQP